MIRFLTLLFFWSVALSLSAQPVAQEEIKSNCLLAASNCLAYPEPANLSQTPAPKGKRPFYLSHFGRHGSRYLINTRDYNFVLDILLKASHLDKLSPLGKDVLQRIIRLNEDAEDKLGELSPLGIRQQKDIVRRMARNYPGLFKGKAVVDAHSTMVLRCVFSMENAVQELLSMNPRLQITHEANRDDMRNLNFIDKQLAANITKPANRKAYDVFCQKHQSWQRPMGQLFNDTTYFNHHVNGERLNYYIFRMAGSIQNTELADSLTLYDLYTDQEIYNNWRMENAYWFLGYGFTSLNGGKQPFGQRHLLRHIIHQADSCIALPKPGVQLRYSHETALLPLVCLMDINGYGQQIDDVEQLEQRGWVNYRIIPMSANLQLVFYRHDPSDKDVLVKVLFNEQEATLPIKSDIAPYYRWADVRRYYQTLLDSYQEKK